MKTTKRILATLLALALGLALLAPAALAADPPAFTTHMRGIHVVRSGQTITLEAEAALPAGVKAQLKYQWYASGWAAQSANVDEKTAVYYAVKGATEPTLKVSPKAEDYGEVTSPQRRYYRLEAYYTQNGKKVSAYDYTAVNGFFTLTSMYQAYATQAKDAVGDSQAWQLLLIPGAFQASFVQNELAHIYYSVASFFSWIFRF